MKQPATAFEKMRKHKDARELRAREFKNYLAQLDQRAEIRRLEREAFDRKLKQELDDNDRKMKDAMERVTYEAGMAMWGCDLHAAMFGPVAFSVPPPPLYGGKPYEMAKIPRPA